MKGTDALGSMKGKEADDMRIREQLQFEYEREVSDNQKGKSESDQTYNPNILEKKKIELNLDNSYHSNIVYDFQEDETLSTSVGKKEKSVKNKRDIIKEDNNIKAKIINNANNNYNKNRQLNTKITSRDHGRRNIYVDDGYFHPRFVNFFNRTGLPKHIREDREQYRKNLESAGMNMEKQQQGSEEEVQGQLDRNLKYTNSDDCGVYPNPDPCCIRCLDLEYCTVLNNKYIEDTYTPGASHYHGSCKNIEDQATRLDIFGHDRSFRDTSLCRSLVYQYTCLTWASDSDMYSNRCDTCCANLQDDGSEGVPLTPCRSHCLQIANICANNLDWKELCSSIPCPPRDTTCDTGPYADALVTGFPACYVSKYYTPSPASTIRGTLSLWLVLGTVLISMYTFSQEVLLK